jgi:DNA-binding transcriptional ArsR family regulator
VTLDATFAALSDPTRRAVVDLLRRGPRRAGELSEALGTSPPAMSRHLRVLRECGLVAEERGAEDARVRVLRLRAEPFDELRHWVDEVEQFWAGQLEAFRAHAERRRARPPRPPGRTPGRR